MSGGTQLLEAVCRKNKRNSLDTDLRIDAEENPIMSDVLMGFPDIEVPFLPIACGGTLFSDDDIRRYIYDGSMLACQHMNSHGWCRTIFCELGDTFESNAPAFVARVRKMLLLTFMGGGTCCEL